MLGMHRHGELLGGNNEERLRRERAAREHAATLEMEDGGGAGLLLKPAGTKSKLSSTFKGQGKGLLEASV